MLLDLFASLRKWGARLPRAAQQAVLAGALLAGVALCALGAVAGLGTGNPLAVLLGCAAGVGWVLAANFAYWFWLPDATRQRLDWRARMPLGRRRIAAAAAALAWFAVLLLSSGVAGERATTLIGALNVLVLVSLARYAVASDGEREEWSRVKEAQLRQQAFADAYQKGLIDADGNPTPLAGARRARRWRKRTPDRPAPDPAAWLRDRAGLED